QAGKADHQLVIAVRDSQSGRWLDSPASELDKRDNHGRRGLRRLLRGEMEAGDAPASADPHAAIRVGEQGLADAIVPQQTLRLAVVMPVLAVKRVYAVVG